MTEYERFCLQKIGENKETIKNIVNNGGLNWNYGINRILSCIDTIINYQKFIEEEEEKVSSIDKYDAFSRKLDYEFETPAKEFVQHQRLKERRRQSIVRKKKRNKSGE